MINGWNFIKWLKRRRTLKSKIKIKMKLNSQRTQKNSHSNQTLTNINISTLLKEIFLLMLLKLQSYKNRKLILVMQHRDKLEKDHNQPQLEEACLANKMPQKPQSVQILMPMSNSKNREYKTKNPCPDLQAPVQTNLSIREKNHFSMLM